MFFNYTATEAHICGLSVLDEIKLNKIRIFKKKSITTNGMIEKAVAKFGQDLVDLVVKIVNISDSDGAYTLFKDYGMHDGVECVRFLYIKD